MLLSQFDQESALGESLWAAANSTPLDCAAQLSWHIQVRSLLDYIKLGDVLQPQTGIQRWDCTTASPKEPLRTRIAQIQDSQQQAFSAQWSAWPDMASQQCCGASNLKDPNAKTVKYLQPPVWLFWMCTCVSFPPLQTNLNLKYNILQCGRKRRACGTHNSISERVINVLLRKTNKPKQSKRNPCILPLYLYKSFSFHVPRIRLFSKFRLQKMLPKFTGTAMLLVSLI